MDKENQKNSPSLTERVVRGAGWVFAGKIAGQTLTLIKLVVLARLLAKTDFGLYGIVLLSIATLQTFSQTGFDKALIQRKGDIKPYLDTAWTVQIIRGILLALILFAIAPAIGWFFNEIRVVSMLRVMCISVLLGGFQNIGVIYFQRAFEFRKNFVYDVGSALISLVVGVILAITLRSAWALVWAGMAGAGARVILSYLLIRSRPRARFVMQETVEMFQYGRWVLAYTVLAFLATQGDDIFLGKVIGASALGIYQVAFHIANAPTTEISNVIGTVMFPAYARVQHDQERLGRAFLSAFEVTLVLCLPISMFIITAAPEIVIGLLGSKWKEAIVPLQLLAVAGFMRTLTATGGPVFAGTGNPQLDFWMNFWRVSIMALTIYPLTKFFGVAGTSLSVVLGLFATVPVCTRVLPIVRINWKELLARCWPALVLAVLVPVGVYMIKLLPYINIQMVLVWQTLAASTLCVAGSLLIWRWFRRGPFAQMAKAYEILRISYTAV